MKRLGKAVLIALGTSSLVFAPNAFATNGYFTHGNGTKNKGMAGAGIAMPEEAMAISNNPASALLVEDRVEVGAGLFNPNRSYTSSDSLAQGNGGAFTIGPNSIDSAREFFVIPHIAMTRQIDEKSAWGAAFYGRGGMNTRWEGGTASFDPDGPGPAPVGAYPGTFGAGAFGGTDRVGIDLMQAFLDVSYARKLTDGLSVGVGLVAAAQLFEAVGLEAFTPYTQTFVDTVFATGDQMQAFGAVDSLTGNGHDTSYGIGAKLGLNAALSDNVSFAAMYQTELDMSEFEDYSDLFAGGGDFDIPANFKAGFTVKADQLAFNVDIDHTWFSDVDSVGNNMANLFTCPSANGFTTMTTEGCLGGNSGAGFGWDDMTVYKVGAQWGKSDGMTWRVGYSHGSQPIPDSEVLFNIMAPATIEDHITFGFTKSMGEKRELNFAFMHALSNSVKGTNPFDPTQTIELEMDQFDIEMGYTWKF